MSLSEQDKQRIREEEAFRLQVRKELQRKDPNMLLKMIVFWVVLLTTAIVAFIIVHKHSG